MRLGGLEAGGTKMVLSVGDENGNIVKRLRLDTLSPSETVPPMLDFFRENEVEALGIGSFGPLDLDKKSKTYGSITATPKLPWRDYPLLSVMRDAVKVPALIDTDVNAAALGEAMLGAAKGLSSCAYVTIGTGIGGGIFVEGKLLHGLMHPELGHIPLRPREIDPLPCGVCPYHKGCLEGLASGPSIEKRWGVKPAELPENHPAWELEAEYLADMAASIVLMLSPEKIILGGGIMHVKGLIEKVRAKTIAALGGYVRRREILEGIDDYIVLPALGDNAGAVGALLLAAQAKNESEEYK